MDELLRTPRLGGERARRASAGTEQKSDRKASGFFAAVEAGIGQLRQQGVRAFHKLSSAAAGHHVFDPLPFLAVSAVMGMIAILGTVYTPAYTVSVDGVKIGTVSTPTVFERVAARVEGRASQVLGHTY